MQSIGIDQHQFGQASITGKQNLEHEQAFLRQSQAQNEYEDPFAQKNFKPITDDEYTAIEDSIIANEGPKQSIGDLIIEYFLPFTLTINAVFYILKGNVRRTNLLSLVVRSLILDILRISIFVSVYYLYTHDQSHYLYYPAIFIVLFYIFSFFAFIVLTAISNTPQRDKKIQILEQSTDMDIDLSFFYLEFIENENDKHGMVQHRKYFSPNHPLKLEGDYMYPGTSLVDHCLRPKNQTFYRLVDNLVIFLLLGKCSYIYYVYFYIVNKTEIKHEFEFEVILLLTGLSIFLFASSKASPEFSGILINNDLSRKADGLGRLTNLICRLKNKDYPIDKDLPTINIFSVTSLETWDNCRRLTIQLGSDFQQQEDLKISVLGVYILGLVGMIMFINTDIVKQLIQFTNDLPTIIIYCDIAALFIPIFFRLLHGAYINQAFDSHKKYIFLLKVIYQEIANQANLYLNIDKNQIQSALYRQAVQQISKKIERRQGKLDEKDLQQQVSEYANTLVSTADKIIAQIEFDAIENQVKFLGLIPSSFELFKTGLALIFPILLTVITTQLG